jgi:hypothetical protein
MTAIQTGTATVEPYMVMETPRELRELRQWVEDPSRPTVDIEAFYTALFDSVSLAGSASIDDLHEFANDTGYGDALYGQHELLRYEQHQLAMLVIQAGLAITKQLNTLCLYDAEGLFPYYFRACYPNGLLLFESCQ